MYDIGIIGAGPAGATLARLVGDRYRVLLLDSGRTKCCGGILAPEAQTMLARLELALPKTVLADPQPYAVAVVDTTSKLIRHYPRRYVNIDRLAFDRWLRSLVPDSVDLRSRAVYRFSEPVEPGSPSRTIHFTEQGEKRTTSVRLLIGADGAASTIRREFFRDHRTLRRYIAVQDGYARDAVSTAANGASSNIDFWNDYVGIFDREFTDFYAWTIPKDDRLIVGGALPFGPHSRPRFEDLKRRLTAFGLHLAKKPAYREAGQIVRPMSTAAIQLGSDRIALVGEAAGLISPSSAEGISAALAGAAALAETLLDGDMDLSRYRKNVRGLLWGIWRKNLKSPAMFNPWLRRQIMRSTLTALEKSR